MAKDAHDREDLLRDATGYVHRVEFTIADRQEPVFCGFRECGAFSLYWTQADVLQFNSAGELRRAFWDDRMLASYKQELHWLQKSDGRIRLQRTPLTEKELHDFLSKVSEWLNQVRAGLTNESITNVDEFPAGANVRHRVAEWIDDRDCKLLLAIHPGLGKKQPVDKKASRLSQNNETRGS